MKKRLRKDSYVSFRGEFLVRVWLQSVVVQAITRIIAVAALAVIRHLWRINHSS